ncbi:DUF3040 domain-containing protein [Laspinema palackyanum]|uniref:DUF3040 domain-containing protein n=1 Tax=Laspinema palackyanum TaxID=3231601 RepID=UPI00345D1516|nr:DUF3040 domain-containing protein [Laspinema sp. D2c]
MNDKRNPDKELAEREREIAERERSLRLREMEMELYKAEPPLYQTIKEEPVESKRQRWGRQLKRVGKYALVVVLVFTAVRVGTMLASAVIVGAIAWVGYKLFFDSDKPNK